MGTGRDTVTAFYKVMLPVNRWIIDEKHADWDGKKAGSGGASTVSFCQSVEDAPSKGEWWTVIYSDTRSDPIVPSGGAVLIVQKLLDSDGCG